MWQHDALHLAEKLLAPRDALLHGMLGTGKTELVHGGNGIRECDSVMQDVGRINQRLLKERQQRRPCPPVSAPQHLRPCPRTAAGSGAT
jgi:hypothetical protein